MIQLRYTVITTHHSYIVVVTITDKMFKIKIKKEKL